LIISFYKLLFFITIYYTQKQWLWAFRFRFPSTAFYVRLADCCLVAQQQVVKSCVSDHLPFKIHQFLIFLVDLLSHFKLHLFVVQLMQGSCLYVISNEHLSICLVTVIWTYSRHFWFSLFVTVFTQMFSWNNFSVVFFKYVITWIS